VNLNLLHVLRAKRNQQLFYDNCHYTPDGNSVVAGLIANFIVNEKLIRP
jgi:hypothetical protein